MAEKSIRQQYREACRAYRLMRRIKHYEYRFEDVDWQIQEYALSSYPAAPVYQVPREENRIIGIKGLYFVWHSGKFHRCEDGHIYRDSGNFYVLHEGKFEPYTDHLVMTKLMAGWYRTTYRGITYEIYKFNDGMWGLYTDSRDDGDCIWIDKRLKDCKRHIASLKKAS